MTARATPAVATAATYELIAIGDGTLLALKWLALVLMTGDHVNKFLMGSESAWLFGAGRLVMPIFAIVLGINLARPSALASGAVDRTGGRLLVMGVVATLPFMLLGGDIIAGWPLNVLFTLAVAAMVIQCLSRPSPKHRTALAVGFFLVGGLLVEYWWPAISLTVGTWLYLRGRSAKGMLLASFGLLGLCAINGNAWALLVLPLFGLATRLSIPAFNRTRAFFYAYYPAHLLAILAIARLKHLL